MKRLRIIVAVTLHVIIAMVTVVYIVLRIAEKRYPDEPKRFCQHESSR